MTCPATQAIPAKMAGPVRRDGIRFTSNARPRFSIMAVSSGTHSGCEPWFCESYLYQTAACGNAGCPFTGEIWLRWWMDTRMGWDGLCRRCLAMWQDWATVLAAHLHHATWRSRTSLTCQVGELRATHMRVYGKGACPGREGMSWAPHLGHW